jgi:hypothetical protein
MFIFQDGNGSSHLIDGSETLRKSLGLPCGARTIFMTDEDGRVLSAGNNIHQLERNAQLIKSLRHDDDGDYDDELIKEAGEIAKRQKRVSRFVADMPKAEAEKRVKSVERRLILPKKSAGGQSASKPTVKPNTSMFSKSLPRSESRGGLLGLVAEFQALHEAHGLS